MTRPATERSASAAGDLREDVKRYYTERLQAGRGCCGEGVPLSADLEDSVPSFGCGQPTLFAELRPGERVLDLGSGAGLDAFRAAEAVGPSGHVTGIDMTPAMLARARQGTRRLGLDNVRFVEGVIEALPLPDGTFDAILSNCVVNLSSDKGAVFREAFRVLRPGGRLAISDVLRRHEPAQPVTRDGWCACVDGAETAERYRAHLQDAGFADIRIDGEGEGETYSALVRAVSPEVRPAVPTDLPAVRRLLADAGLPTAGLGAAGVELFVVGNAAGDIVGVVGFEAHGEAALLRSLAVIAEARGRGLGVALIHHVERRARERGARRAFALTTTIAPLLDRIGYALAPRDALPSALLDSPELQGACPASASVHVRSLPAEPPRR